jgi:hypothetical protein
MGRVSAGWLSPSVLKRNAMYYCWPFASADAWRVSSGVMPTTLLRRTPRLRAFHRCAIIAHFVAEQRLRRGGAAHRGLLPPCPRRWLCSLLPTFFARRLLRGCAHASRFLPRVLVPLVYVPGVSCDHLDVLHIVGSARRYRTYNGWSTHPPVGVGDSRDLSDVVPRQQPRATPPLPYWQTCLPLAYGMRFTSRILRRTGLYAYARTVPAPLC